MHLPASMSQFSTTVCGKVRRQGEWHAGSRGNYSTTTQSMDKLVSSILKSHLKGHGPNLELMILTMLNFISCSYYNLWSYFGNHSSRWWCGVHCGHDHNDYHSLCVYREKEEEKVRLSDLQYKIPIPVKQVPKN